MNTSLYDFDPAAHNPLIDSQPLTGIIDPIAPEKLAALIDLLARCSEGDN